MLPVEDDFDHLAMRRLCIPLANHQLRICNLRRQIRAFSTDLPYSTPAYEGAHAQSIGKHSRDEFWGEAAKSVDWVKDFDSVLDTANPPFYKWYPGGEINTCYNALDRHVKNGRGGQIAIVHDSPVTNTIQRITYSDLLDQVAKFAGVLYSKGVQKGDTVIVYMPMVPEAIVVMLVEFCPN